MEFFVADKLTRLGNYIIDKTVFALLLILNAVILDGVLHVVPKDGSPVLGLYFFVLYFSYHFLFEYFFGKTPGKFVTNTLVTDFHGEKPKFKALPIRNLSRIIAFDLLSFLFGEGWHDSISKTKVIVIRNSAGFF